MRVCVRVAVCTSIDGVTSNTICRIYIFGSNETLLRTCVGLDAIETFTDSLFFMSWCVRVCACPCVCFCVRRIKS